MFTFSTKKTIAGIALIFLATPLTGHAKPMQLEDVFALEYASQPQSSVDGKTVYFVRNYMDIQKDQARSNIWQVNTKTGALAPVTSGLANDHSPVLSPNGERLAYVSSRDGSSQIYMVWLGSGQSALLSQLSNGAGNLVWAPNGKQLYFTQFVKSKSDSPVSLPGKPDGAKWADSPVYIDSTYYRADGAGFLDKGYEQIFVIDANGGSARQLTHEKMDHSGPLSIDVDGKQLYFSATPDPEHNILNSDLYALDLNSLNSTVLTDRNGPDQHGRLSPDGKKIAYTGFDDRQKLYEVTRLYVKDLSSGKVSLITDQLERDVSEFYWRDDGKGFYISFDDQGDSVVAWQPLKGPHQELTRSLGGTELGRPYASGQFSIGHGQLVFTHNNTDRPAEIAVMELPKGKVRVLTDLNNDLNHRIDMSPIETVNFSSSVDHRNIQGWLAFPPNFDRSKKYPLMLEIHGGPVANYGPRFTAEIQLYAAAGYVVLYVNPRGSDSYGPEFVNLIHHNYPSQDYDDLMDGVDTVIKRGYIDDQQLFVTGGSGGGALTAWIVGHTDRFKAAVVAKPVINWFSFTLTADFYPYFTRYWFAKKPWEDAQHYMQRSPINYVGNVKTPTMLLTGESDYRTPISETEQFYQALKLQDVDTAMVRIPGTGHHITTRPSNLMNKVAYVLWWFEKHGGPNFKKESAADIPADSDQPQR